MANRRMFSKDITNSEEFIEMPEGSQSLYFHLGMNADDEGFVQPKAVMRLVEAKEDSLRILIAKGFVIHFGSPNKVIVITHWKLNNELKKDRVKKTLFQEEKKLLLLNGGIYKMSPECLQNVSKLETQVSIGKVSIEENSIGKSEPQNNFLEPSDSEIEDYEGDEPKESLPASDFFSAKNKKAIKSSVTNFRGEIIPIHQKAPKNPPRARILPKNDTLGKETFAILDDVVYEEEEQPKKTQRKTPEKIADLNMVQAVFKEFGFKMSKVTKKGSSFDLNIPVLQKIKEEDYDGNMQALVDDLRICLAEMARGEKYFPTFENMLEYKEKWTKIKLYFTRKNKE